MTEDEMLQWLHGLSGHEFKQTPGDNEEQGSLACCSPWGQTSRTHDLVTEQQQPMCQMAVLTLEPCGRVQT